MSFDPVFVRHEKWIRVPFVLCAIIITLMEIRAICSDIDGTLLDSARALSVRTVQAIKRLSTDISVVLASSRMPSAMRHLQFELGIEYHPMICYNGAYILWYRETLLDPVVIGSVQISLSVCKRIVKLSNNFSIHVSLYSFDDWYASKLDQWTIKEEMVTKVSPKIMDFDHVFDKWQRSEFGAHKIMCMGPSEEIERLTQALHDEVSTDIHIYRSKSTYLELAPRSVSKASALHNVMERCLNLSAASAMAFGDNYNDIDMIREAGFGIAVDNAIPEVKAVAREITASNKNDGVAMALERHFNLR